MKTYWDIFLGQEYVNPSSLSASQGKSVTQKLGGPTFFHFKLFKQAFLQTEHNSQIGNTDFFVY